MEGGGGGGPAPFLVKTYDMVDDSSTDEIVSWSSTLNSFVVWNPPEFARLLLPTYFKHNNFSSFIRQLNTYGFRKIDPERWEFANEDFVKDKKHLLKNIHRRKPIHSHSNPQGSAVDPERAAFEEEIDKLSREKTALEANLIRSKQRQPAAKLQLDELTQKVVDMEQRQVSLQAFLEKAVQNPDFVEHLALKLESMDCLAYNKRRRLPRIDHSQTVQEDSFGDDNSSSRHEFGNIFGQDFSKKLTLELSPAVSDVNLISHSTQSSNEEGLSPQRRVSEHSKVSYTRSGNLLYAPETLDLSDTGADSSFSRDAGPSESRKFTSNEEGDGHISCQLNLTLASTPLLVNKSRYSARMPQLGQEIGKSNVGVNEGDVRVPQKTRPPDDDATLSAPHDVPINKQAPRVNDLFWEQFLTERPGASETEEASSNFRGRPYGEQEDRRSGHGLTL